MPNAIEVKNLSKKFVHYPSQRDRFIDMATGGKIKRGTDFWALKDISFEVPQGTTFGIIGQNGSGKSTLLSILAGVLQPTSGIFKVNGKVAAILELGSGFHHEFTGRENVYMYGTILGLSKAEIDRRFDEIVDFSELHEFIDRPLYTYSSGMIMRLAFAVVINVDADILIIDEALAVGDAIFQHRCMNKIKELKTFGITILYVGHDTEAVRNMCDSAMLLDSGKIFFKGMSNIVINKYLALIADRERQNLKLIVGAPDKKVSQGCSIIDSEMFGNSEEWSIEERYGNFKIEIRKIELLGGLEGEKIFSAGEIIRVRTHCYVNEDISENLIVGCTLKNKHTIIYATNTLWQGISICDRRKGDIFYVEFLIKLTIANGVYSISVGIVEGSDEHNLEVLDRRYDSLFFHVVGSRKMGGIVDLDSMIQCVEVCTK